MLDYKNYLFKVNHYARVYLLLSLPALWPFLNFLNINRYEFFSRADAFLYLIIFLLIIYSIFFIFSFLLKKNLTLNESAVLSSIFIIAFFSYPLTYDLAYFFFKGKYLTTWITTTTIILIISYLLIRSKQFQNFIFFMNVALVSIVFIQLTFNSLQETFTKKTTNNSIQEIYSKKPHENQTLINKETKVSVYYLILDEYGRKDTLEEIYKFDNTPFIDRLKNKKFYIVDKSSSNYNSTVFSLSSILNMDYLFTDQRSVSDSQIHNIVYKNLNLTHDMFKKLGYKTATLRFNGSDCKNSKNYCYDTNQIYFGDLEVNLIKLTPFNSIVSIISNLSMEPRYAEFKDLNKFLKLNKYEKPVFGYFHMLIPHLPYRFDSQCNTIAVKNNLSLLEQKNLYIEQLKCANKQTLEFIKLIKKNDPESIIIITSDHGPKIGVDFEHLKKDYLGKNWMQSYNAFLAINIPNNLQCKKYLNSDITLINTFRLIKGCLTNEKPKFLRNRWFLYENEEKKIYELEK